MTMGPRTRPISAITISAQRRICHRFIAALKNITGQMLTCSYTICDTALQGQVVNPDKFERHLPNQRFELAW